MRLHYSTLVPILCGMLAGCAAETCSAPQEVSEIPLLRSGTHEIVPVMLNGQAAGLILDTGAHQTTLTPQAVADLKLPAQDSFVQVSGIGGLGSSVNAKVADIASMRVGGAPISDAQAWVVPLSREGLAQDPAYGLLGIDVLTNFDLDLDAGSDRLTLYMPQNCPVAAPAWSGAFQEVDIPRALSDAIDQSSDIAKATPEYHRRITEQSGEILFRVTLGGRVLTAKIDTGSAVSTVRQDMTGLSDADMAGDRLRRIRGIGLLETDVRAHRFDDLQIGGTSFGPIVAGVGDFRLNDVDMLIGEDFLHKHRIYVAYAAGKLFIAR